MAVPREEIARREERVREGLRAAGLDAALVVEASGLVYLTGAVADAHLLVPAEGPPVALVRRGLERIRDEAPWLDARPLASLRAIPPLLDGLGCRRLGLELDVLPVARYRRLEALLEGVELADAAPVLAEARAVKSPWEIERCREAADQLAAAFAAAPELVATCATDLEVQIELERVLRRAGHQGPLRFRGLNGQMLYGTVLGGPDGAVAPWSDTPLGGPGVNATVGKGPGGWRLRPGDAVTVDLVGASEGYAADATRTLFRGDPDPRLAEALAACEAILADLEGMMVPGTPAGSLYDRGLELAEAAGFGAAWMGAGPARVRFVGHGIGLEINELPFLAHGLDRPFQEGNVIAVEPKLVFPGLGAVGVEDTYVVRAGGPERLTRG